MRGRRIFRDSLSSSDSALGALRLPGSNLSTDFDLFFMGSLEDLDLDDSDSDSEWMSPDLRRRWIWSWLLRRWGGGDAGAELSPLEASLLRGCFSLAKGRFFLSSKEAAAASEEIPLRSPSLPSFRLFLGGGNTSSISPSLLSSCLITLRGFEGERPSFPGRTIVSASEFWSTSTSSSRALVNVVAGRESLDEEGVLAAGGNLTLFVVVLFAVTVGLASDSTPPRFGEAACFVFADSTAFCASIAFNSYTEI
ncbi:hypothetical protein F4781DRAFT_233928 [Annulohypoxylon bovei var. microspora]|nr:hypothetical protein F4781DRAFT_233928 [Annulohypoxylon bovei var. microspora]